jgi:hypothetical protein
MKQGLSQVVLVEVPASLAHISEDLTRKNLKQKCARPSHTVRVEGKGNNYK